MTVSARVRMTVLALLGVALAAATSSAATDEAAEAFRAARAYTVRIRAQITTPFVEDERGSFEGAGFLVDAARGWIVTNAHVVGHSPSQIQVAFADGPYEPARKVYVDSFADIAVIHVDGVDPDRRTASLDCGGTPSAGEPVGAYGHPLGLPFTGSRGIVSARTDQLGPDMLQIDATVDHGNSGGPVILLRTGRVVGIATALAGDAKTDRLNFATPTRDVCRILDLLRRGESPCPPAMKFALLKDEDGRHTLRVGRTFDAAHWPFEPGDRILAVEGARDTFVTLSDFVGALRGRTGAVPLVVERAGHRAVVVTHPTPRPPVTDRWAVSVDGALIAPIRFEDGAELSEPVSLIVHSVEPGSTAEALGLDQYDIVESVDGRAFSDLDTLLDYLNTRDPGPLELVIRRWSVQEHRLFDYDSRELPGDDVHVVGPGPESKTGDTNPDSN